jgi:hypothetical protein
LVYTLNPLQPCGGKLAAGHWVAALTDVPSALEATVAAAGQTTDPIDPHMVAFIAARSDRRLGIDINALNVTDSDNRLIGLLRLLSEMQSRFDPRPLPGLAGWFATQAGPLVARWKNRTKRAAVAEQLTGLASAGQLASMLALIEDPNGHAADAEGADQATAELARIDSELAGIDQGGALRALAAARTGQEIAAGVGLTGLALALIAAALG